MGDALHDPRGMRHASMTGRRTNLKMEHPLSQIGNEEKTVATNKQLPSARNYHPGSKGVLNGQAVFIRHCSEGPQLNLGKVAMNATLKKRSMSDILASGNLTSTTKCSISPH